ncbi:RidA family protein [Gordonia sp. HNM0687]|uniref:RidA family protein n=1 Tax=Gordonia mangrovi TaxID=2665643 RepID=A0A6L7GL46_9ACTN|nr:RidA family protein [Gordonia mangrovi]MXP20117.1 RidA family protein [Gordonia mangrovi]UVF79273.1 RidA family protein [Gordonia mangrovi]
MNTAVFTDAETVGFYSPAVITPPGAQLVSVAGQLSTDVDGNSVGVGDFETQLRTVFGHLDSVLTASGSSLAEVVKFTTYLVDPDHIAEFYRVRELIFADLYPNRRPPGNTLLVIQRLVRPEFLVEIEALATTHTPIPEGALHVG